MSSNPDLSTDDLAGRGAERPQEAGEGRPADRPGVPPTGDPGSGQTAVGTGQQDVGGVGSRDERYADASDPAAGVQGGDRTSADIPTQQMSSGVGATASTGDTESLQDRPGGASATPGGEQGGDRDVGLLDPSDEQRFRQQWSDAQARFVDDPR